MRIICLAMIAVLVLYLPICLWRETNWALRIMLLLFCLVGEAVLYALVVYL